MAERLKTLQEVVDKAEELIEDKDLVAFDRELIETFDLGTIKGTVQQLTVVLQALRTSAMAVTNGILDNLGEDINKIPEEDNDGHYDA